MAKHTSKTINNAGANKHHELLKHQAELALDTLLQDRGVTTSQVLESMQYFEALIEGNIEGLEDELKKNSEK